MNVSIYTFGEFTTGYSQYPSDYTTDIFQEFYRKSKAQTQLCIHRNGDIMYYAYIRKLADERYIGICAVINGLMLSDVHSVFKLFEQMISGMISRGELIMFDGQGNITTNVTQLYLEKEIIENIQQALRSQFDRLQTHDLPTVKYSVAKDSVKDFTVENSVQDIIAASSKYGYTYVYKDKDYETGQTNSHKAVISKLAKEKEELQKRCDDLSKQLTDEKSKQGKTKTSKKKPTSRWKKVLKWFLIIFVVLAALFTGFAYWLWHGSQTTNPNNYATVGDIPTPSGYERLDPIDNSFATYLRSLPLKEAGSKVQLYTGGESRLQSLAYAVVDMPLLSNDEQCADVCMRLRAEYLFDSGRYKDIHFRSVSGKEMRYSGKKSRKAFERYMRNVYGAANTYSLKQELPKRYFPHIQPGDVFVYAAGDHDLERKTHSKYGHAIMVVDVAVDEKGNKAIMLAEGNTPARDIHILRNWTNPFASPWFYIDTEDEELFFDCFYYKADELRYFQ